MMQFAMMPPTERDRELVTDFAPERPVLRKAQMMGIARPAPADQTGLPGDKPHMLAIAESPCVRRAPGLPQ